jgi:hypothetical protein
MRPQHASDDEEETGNEACAQGGEVMSEDAHLTPDLNKALDALFVSTGKTPELIYDPDDKVLVEMVNQVRDKLAEEAKQKHELVWKYRNHK